MSFDQDPSEQAQISGADFALMCDEMKRLQAANAELAAALQAMADDLNSNLSKGSAGPWPFSMETTLLARAALAKHKGETP